jgi:hypothetical protein
MGDDGNAVWKHPGQLCRLCANNTGDAIYIFSSAGKQLNIADKINSSLPVLVCMKAELLGCDFPDQ